MSFEQFLEKWASDPKEIKQHEPISLKTAPSRCLTECEILHRGTTTHVIEELSGDNVCWLRDQTDALRWCYCTSAGDFVELSHRQLEQLYGERIRDHAFSMHNNQRILPNGIQVPVVPPTFIDAVLDKVQERKKRKVQQRKLKKGLLAHTNSILWFFNENAAPTRAECFASVFVLPRQIFAKDTDEVPAETAPTPTSALFELLNHARDAVQKHPLYAEQLKTCCLDRVQTLDDLVNLTIKDGDRDVKIGPEIISVFNRFFPKEVK
tara:strand:+ start:1601 stop:2395 length:795 start_codon:yes stop_codon:yes gene_type:complete